MAKDRTNEAVEANEAQPTEATKRDEVQEQTVNEAEAIFESTLNAEPEEEPQITLPKLYVYRRRYTNKSDGKQYWEYVLPAVFCGQTAEVLFKCDDVTGYQMLERLFDDGAKKVEFHAVENKQYDDHTNTTRKYWTYSVAFKDKDGFDWNYPLKVRRTSDRAICENYFRYLLFKAARQAKVSNE